MKFKGSFARVISEAQLVEVLIEADSKEEAYNKYLNGDFARFLVVKRELKDTTPVGDPQFEQVG